MEYATNGSFGNTTTAYSFGVQRESFVENASGMGAGAAIGGMTYQSSGTYYYTGTGSVANVTGSATNQSYSYTASGSMTAYAMGASAGVAGNTTGTLTTNPTAYGTYGVYGYNGEYTHTNLGLQYLRARYLNVATGTFTSRDTYAGRMQDILSQNRYTYAENNPVGHSDPSGHAVMGSLITTAFRNATTSRADKARAATQAAVSAYAEEQKNRYTSVNRSVDNYRTREQRNNAWLQQLDGYAGSVLNGYHSILNATVYENNAVDNRWIKAIALSSEAIACASYTSCRNGIQELIKGKDAGRITHGSGLILEGTAKVFGSVFAATLSAGSAATGAGTPLAAFFATESIWLLSGSMSDVKQGINELVLGWNGDSLTKTEHLFSDTYYGGDFVTYQMHMDAMMIATDVYVLAKALPQVLTKKGDDLVETTLRQTGKDGNGVKYSPVNPGPLSEDVANSFNGATYTERILTEDTIMYRVSGGNAKEVGSYMSMTPQGGGLQSQLDLALNPAWGNTTENVTKVVVPKGTTIYEGIAAPQNIYDDLGNVIGTLPGGGNQVYIPTVEAGWVQ